jgi:hypothetical protein
MAVREEEAFREEEVVAREKSVNRAGAAERNSGTVEQETWAREPAYNCTIVFCFTGTGMRAARGGRAGGRAGCVRDF